MLGKSGSAVHISGGAKLFGNRAQRQIFNVEFAVALVEVGHNKTRIDEVTERQILPQVVQAAAYTADPFGRNLLMRDRKIRKARRKISLSVPSLRGPTVGSRALEQGQNSPQYTLARAAVTTKLRDRLRRVRARSVLDSDAVRGSLWPAGNGSVANPFVVQFRRGRGTGRGR